MTAWAAFAKDPQKGLLALGWPVYDSSSKGTVRTKLADTNALTEDTLIMIGNNNRSGLALGPATKYDAVCKIMDSFSGKMDAGR
jgi:hypothetical protein